jgi:hypothetical protein
VKPLQTTFFDGGRRLQMTESIELTTSAEQQRGLERRHLEQSLRDLLLYAQRRGFVVEVCLVPLRPLAMGNYAMAPDVRPARERA